MYVMFPFHHVALSTIQLTIMFLIKFANKQKNKNVKYTMTLFDFTCQLNCRERENKKEFSTTQKQKQVVF